MVPGDRDGCVETFGSWDSGGWSERVVRDFTKGSSINPYSMPPRQTWGHLEQAGGGLMSLHIVVGYGRGPNANLPSSGRIRRHRRDTSWWSWLCARAEARVRSGGPPMSRDGRRRTRCCRGDRRWGGPTAGKGNFLDRDPLPSLSVMDLCSRRIPAACWESRGTQRMYCVPA
jgi:hypothetical protein